MTSNANSLMISGSTATNGVVMQGYLKKLKTMKRKYFVLYEDCGKFKARLEYFDNEKKFKSKCNPKRVIMMDNCFNINRRLDTKFDYVVTLSISDGGFGIVMDTEEEMNTWLKALLTVQSAGPPRPYYEHVWQVVVQRKGLAEKKGILGSYHVCLSSKSLTLLRIGTDRTNLDENRVAEIEFYLTSIRRCGDSKCFFYMEVGRHSVIGAGELWMETKDFRIAQNMHTMILNVMSSNAEDPYGPMRKRSSSATEASKPVAILQRRQTHSGSKTLNSSPLSIGTNRDRCDSLPSSRNRATSESCNSLGATSMPPSRTISSLSTVSSSVCNRHSHSPPLISSTLTPSVGCSESDGSTLSIDEPDSMKHSLTPDESIGFVSNFYNPRSPGDVIPEENVDEFLHTENKKPNNIFDSQSVFDKLNIHTGTMDGKLQFACSSNNNIQYPESQYMEMGCSISPCDTALGESPLTGAEYHFKSCNDSSDCNSRASSLAEEVMDGYVHMSSPPSSDYVDMEQSIKSRRQAYNASASSARGMNFAEYPMEKVNYKIFSDEDEMQTLNEARPPRAYSVGSRVEHNNKKLRIEVIANAEQNNCRVRAFSVGSRSKVPRCDLQRNILLSNANSCNSNGASINNSKSSIASTEPISENAGRGRKSSSAPLLIQKSQNSVDRMDDLMEIDFSKNSSSRSNSLSSQSPGASSSYLPKTSHLRSSISNNSKSQNVAINNKSHDSFVELKPQQPQAENGYLEMRPVIYSHGYDEPVSRTSESSNASLPDKSEIRQPHSEPTHKKQKSDEWTKIETPEGYLEMSWNGNKDNSNRAGIEQPSTTKSRSPSSVTDAKKAPALGKMHSSAFNQGLANRSIPPNSKQTTHFNQKNTSNVLGKPDNNLRIRFFEPVNSSFTISEEKTSSADQDSISDKFSDMFIQQTTSRNTSDLSELDNKLSLAAADSVSSDYVNFTPVPAQPMSSAKSTNNENETSGKDKKRLSDRQQNVSKEKRSSFDNKCESRECKLRSSSSEDSPTDNGNKPNRKSNSPTCTPTSPFLSSSRCHRFSNANRQTKNTNTNSGYELLHICSDSSLQTKKNVSRPSSVNSDRIFLLENAQGRPNSVNADCLQSNSVSSSIATLCITSLAPSKNCDNRSHDQLLTLKSVPMNNNMYTDDNKPPDNNSPVLKNAEQPPLNPQLELHYASLDLPVSSTKNSNTTIHGSHNNPTRSSLSDDTATSLSPNSATTQQTAFTYAKIGFIQCENKKLKCITQPNL